MRLCKTCGGRLSPRALGDACSACNRSLPLSATANYARGSAHRAWRGNDATPDVKRKRARRIYPLGACEMCGDPAIDRHHKNGDTGDNSKENIATLCRRCHMESDGRMDALRISASKGREKQRKAPAPCVNCAKVVKIRRRGRCNACSLYFTKYGIERSHDRFLGPLRAHVSKTVCVIASYDREPTDDEIYNRPVYVPDDRQENDRTL